MYRYEETEMLAQTIIRLFEQKKFSKYSSNVKDIAHNRHNKEINMHKFE